MKTQSTLQEAADELGSYQTILEDVLYADYGKEELQTKLRKLSKLQRELEELARTLAPVKDIMDS